ncbi:MAG: hypothetical protein ACRDGF_05080, partial [Chloroflexota bacterium]
MNLTTALAQQPVTRLQRIVASWRLAFDGPITSKQQLAELLAKHIGNSRVISSLPQLDRGCLALLYHLAGLPQQNTLSRQQVAAIYGKRLPPDEVWQITARLAAAGVLLPVDNDAYYLPSSVRQAFLGDAHSMQLLLGRLNLTQLRSIALKLGVTAAGQWKQDEVLAALHGLLVDPKTLADVRAELSPEAQLILAEALRTQGRPPLQALLRPLPPERRNVVAGQWSWYGHEYGRASNGLVELQQYGLLFPIYSGWGSTVAMPTEVRWALESNEQSLPHLLSPCLQSYQGNDFVAHPSWPADAVRALVFLEQQRPARLKSGGFSKQALRKLAQGLTIQQPEYAGFIISFLLWSGAAVVRQQTFAPVPDADRWLRSLAVAPTDVARELWLTNPYWLEASDNPLTLDYFYGASLLLPLRMAVFELVATIPPGGATTATFLDLLDFQQPTSTASAPPGAVVDMLRAMQWLGLLELAGEPLAGLRPAARARLATKDAPAYASTKFVVQPNLEIVAPPDLELTLLRCLLRFTDGAAATGATVARLTQD